MASMPTTQNALQEVQWCGMKVGWMKREEQRNTYHQDHVLWGKDITKMVARVVAASELEKEMNTNAVTKGCALEALIDENLTQAGRPKKLEERQPVQPGR
jgi:hypothetical protein